MFKKILSATTLAAAALAASEQENGEKYKEWYSAMGIWGYKWEPHEVTTSDGYTLTLMNVTKKDTLWPTASGLPPMLIVSPMGSTPDSWLDSYLANEDNANPMLLDIRDQGHDLWFLYPRGSPYSSKHEKYDYESKEFWDFGWADMGVIDLRASMEYIMQETDVEKVGLLGFSMGTTEIFAAVAEEYDSFYKDHTYKIAMLAPCTVTDKEMYSVFNAATVKALNWYNIFEIGGPTYYDTVVKIRKVLGIKGLKGFVAQGWGTYLKNISMKSFYHYAQAANEGRFQRYSDSYWNVIGGKKQTDLYDLSVIKDIPMGFFYGTEDTECPNSQTEKTREEIGDAVTFFKAYPGWGHGDFISRNTEEFVNDVLSFLKPSKDEELALQLQ